jgi:glycolate oxidase iron-sulfur subunit
MINRLDILRSADFNIKLKQCIHCGLCLQACPTYAIFGTEMDSPRGRIALMRAAAAGKLTLEDIQGGFTRHIQLCLECRACEAVCPSGVQYGSLVEMARAVVEDNRRPGVGERFLRWVGTKLLMPNLWLLKFTALLMWLYQLTGLQRAVRALHLLPKALRAMENILPPIRMRFTPLATPLPARNGSQGRVLFFTGCIQEAMLSSVNEATIRVLQRNGYAVLAPRGQTCCGAAHLHLGDVEGAKKLARQNIEAFLSSGDEYETMICNAGGCGAALKEYSRLLADDPCYASQAKEFSSKVRDISEFMAGNLLHAPGGRVEARAVYSDSCHLRHVQKVVKQPRELLREVPGLQLVELSLPDRCCGSAGVYNIAEVDTATQILDAKMADIATTGANLIVTSNTGCHLQLLAGVRRAGLDARVMHVVEVLDMAYRAEESK